MATCVLELNDVALTASTGEGILVESPGFALLRRDGVVLGEEAFARARFEPRGINSRFWDRLSLDPLPHAAAGVHTHADLAFRQLSHLWERVGARADAVVAVIPGSFTRQQLGLLLGIARESGLPVVGMVDAAVAAVSTPAPGRRLMHLDVLLHRIVLTQLTQDSQISRGGVDENPKVGLVTLREAWVNIIADTFVRSTRFDPMHGAEAEQTLYDRLPEWLAVLRQHDSVPVEIIQSGKTHAVTIARGRFTQAAAGVYQSIVDLVRSTTRPGESLTIALSHRLRDFPGLAESLAQLANCELVQLERESVTSRVLANEAAVRGADGSVSFVTHLPWAGEGLPAAAPEAQAHGAGAMPRPTHVLYRSRAYAISQEPLLVGSAVSDAPRGLALAGELTGVSRRHCAIVAQDDVVLVEDHSTYGTWVNGRKLDASTSVAVGDRVRLGGPAQELELIAIAD